MSASTENKPQDCKYCKTLIFWDLTIQEKRKWRETISKEVHTFDKCKKIQEKPQATEPQITQQTNPDVKKIEGIDVNQLRKDAMNNLEVINVYEQCVRTYLANHNESNPNPEKVGLYVKLLMERENKK